MGKRKLSGSYSKCDDCPKCESKKSDDGDSQEELDGDSVVVQKGNTANGIRYSARVQEKQEKLRRESSPSKQIITDTLCPITVPTPCPAATKITTVGEENSDTCLLERTFVTSISISGEKKKKRTWELWSQEDKQLFFEALNEFGKDFDAIQTYLASKLKPRSKGSCAQSVPKNKDQVRHFYYRTWNKISKYLTFPKDMKKAYQELYGLINYGELRKKQRVLNLKTAVKLSELVEKGTTTIKVRGKTFRIKTPVCRALKKLNQLEEIDQIRVPCKLCVELVPHDGNTWASVQRVSHNPRVKVFVPLQRTLASLLVYFEERWKTDQNRLKEEFSLSVFGKPRTRLRFFPVESRDLSVPVFKYSEVTSATKISLSSYVQNCLHQERKQDSSLVSKKFKRKIKVESDTGNTALRDADYLAAEADVSDVDCGEGFGENQFRITLRRGTNAGIKASEFGNAEQDNSNGLPDNAFWSVHEENANAAVETDAGETDYCFDDIVPSPTECDTGDEDCLDHGIGENQDGFHEIDGKDEKHTFCPVCKPCDTDENGPSDKSEKVCTCSIKRTVEPESIKCQSLDPETKARGWNADEAGALTLGELYLMLGKSDRLCFEYSWDKSDDDKLREERARSLVEKLVNISRLLKKKKNSRAKSNVLSNITASSFICHKCIKVETPNDCELPNSASMVGTSKDGTSELLTCTDSPPRASSVNQLNNDNPDDSKITLHAVVTSNGGPVTDVCLKSDVAALDSSPTNKSEGLTVVSSETEKNCNDKDEVISAQGLGILDNISPSIPDTNPSIVCSNQKPVVTPQPGLIELSTLTTGSVPDVESTFRRVATNLKATIIPTSTAIIRSVALSNNVLTDGTASTLSGCHPTVATTTVLVSEPTVFAGIATDATPFVTIQQCSASAMSPPPSVPSNTQETKFRRPADVPILMKPCSDDRSTNDDGSVRLNVPKPFLDLPKGNRRIGRRPAWKQRVIIPRMLPLLPKPDATMATLITIPPVVATGLSVLPVTAETLNPVTVSIQPDIDNLPNTAHLVSSSGVTVAVSTIVTTVSMNDMLSTTSNILSGGLTSISGAMSSIKRSSAESNNTTSAADKPVLSKTVPGVEESLDNLSLSSFMDLSIPESTRFIANDLRFDELECSNSSSVNLSGILDDSSRKNTRDPPLLETPKKRSGCDDSCLDIDTPEKLNLNSLDTSWSAMNEGMDFSMGSLFNGSETLRSNSNEPLSEGDLTFQSVIGDGNLDFESKLNDLSALTNRSKE